MLEKQKDGLSVRAKIARERIKIVYRNITSLFFVLTILSVALVSSVIHYGILETKTITVRQALASEDKVEEKIHEEFELSADERIEYLADTIHFKESTNGKFNYSKCEAIGEYNEYGYAIPGDGSYKCYKHGGDRKMVEIWLEKHIAQGMTDRVLLCYYNTGKKVDTCQYAKDIKPKEIKIGS